MKRIEEADTLTHADRELLSELKRVVSEFLPTATLLLYGSAARGAREPDSDYDVLVLLDGPISRQEEDRIRDAIYYLELAREVVVSFIFETREQWNQPVAAVSPYHRNVEREGILL